MESEKFSGMQCDETFGYLESSDELLVRSAINGDVFCRGTVYCGGTVIGNIRANQVQLYHAHVTGDITCRKIITDDISHVQGVVIAESGAVNCRVDGEVKITEPQQKALHKETIR